MATFVAQQNPFQGMFADLKEIEDAYNAEMMKLKRRQRDALRNIELEEERKEVEAMKTRVQHLYGKET